MVSLGVAGVFLAGASTFSQAQKAGDKAEAAKRPAIKFKVFEKNAEVKEEAEKVVRGQVVVKAIRRGRAAVAPGEPNPQLLQQYRPMLWAEYLLAKSVCNLTPDQRKAIARDAEHAFQEAVANPVGNRRRVVRNPNGVLTVVNQGERPEDTIREGLIKAVRDHLKPEQAAKYQVELDKRAVNRRRITADNITAKIDESLILTADQRDKIRASLLANWQDDWCPSPESLLFNARILPQVPDKFIVPLLNEPQKSIWRRLNKYQVGHFTVFGFMANNMMNGGDSPEDEFLREAREAETKARETARMKREAEEKQKAEAKKKEEPAKKK
jgi:hypothetical protein